MKHQNQHQPVLLAETIELLDPKSGESYLDLTAGYGGHADAIMKLIGGRGRAVLVDRDSAATQVLAQQFGDQADIMRQDFVSAASELTEEGNSFDLIMLDLGVSSPQIDNSDRGFSFQSSGPLDMRMDRQQALTADTVVNQYAEDRLAKIIADYGEERFSKRVARAIVAARPIATTASLAAAIRQVVPRSADGIDAATRTFQAIRIEVNAELDSLKAVLPLLPKLLAPNGRVAVISFHSLEDRLVKQFIDRESRDCICGPKTPICICDHRATLAKLTKGPVVAGQPEIANNPRARSAKLRAARKLNQNQKGGNT